MGIVQAKYMEIMDNDATAVEVCVKDESGQTIAIFRNFEDDAEVWENQTEQFQCRDINVILEMYRQKDSGYSEISV